MWWSVLAEPVCATEGAVEAGLLPTAHDCMGGIPTNYHGEAIPPSNGNPEATVAA
jgi:hypothetical protein